VELTSGAIIRSAVTITAKDIETGAVEVRRTHNDFTDDGLHWLLNRMVSSATAVMGHLAVGTGTGAFAGSETAMYDEVYRKAITTASVASNVGRWLIYFSAAELSCAIREFGLANAAGSGAGTLIDHIEISPAVSKSETKELVVDIQTTISRA